MMNILYGIFVVGVLFLAHSLIHKVLSYIWKYLKGRAEGKGNIIFIHLYKHVSAYFDDKDEIWCHKVVWKLIYGMAFIFLACMSLIIKMGSPSMLLIVCSLSASGIPYLWLRVKLASKQITGSYEGRVVIAEILNQYKIQSWNILEAIDSSIENLDETPISKHLLFRMSRKLKLHRADMELKEILKEFSFSTGTQWASLLAQNIYSALAEGINITGGLEDLLSECDYTKKILEQRRRSSNEAFTIIKILCPATYFILMGTLVKYFDFEISDIIYYQIQTPKGILLFFTLIFIAFINMAAITIVGKPKFDF